MALRDALNRLQVELNGVAWLNLLGALEPGQRLGVPSMADEQLAVADHRIGLEVFEASGRS